jgi:hypothetical protein
MNNNTCSSGICEFPKGQNRIGRHIAFLILQLMAYYHSKGDCNPDKDTWYFGVYNPTKYTTSFNFDMKIECKYAI